MMRPLTFHTTRQPDGAPLLDGCTVTVTHRDEDAVEALLGEVRRYVAANRTRPRGREAFETLRNAYVAVADTTVQHVYVGLVLRIPFSSRAFAVGWPSRLVPSPQRWTPRAIWRRVAYRLGLVDTRTVHVVSTVDQGDDGGL